MGKKSLQFEIWQECNTKCDFCYLRSFNKSTPEEFKLRGIQYVIDRISNLNDIKQYDVISLIGGEFFQGQLKEKKVRKLFFEMIQKIANLQVKGYFPEVWLLCTLAIGNQKDLYETLDIFKNTYKKAKKPELMNRFWIVTSYDTLGRFHSKKMEDTWKSHMVKLKKNYPGIRLNTCMMLTGDLVTKYINDEFSFENFRQTYDTNIFLKQVNPVIRDYLADREIPKSVTKLRKNWQEIKEEAEKILPGLLPKRQDFLKFLKKLRDESPDIFQASLNIEYRADDLYRNAPREAEDEGYIEYLPRHKNKLIDQFKDPIDYINKCGHLSKYAAYLDSDACMLCDKNNLD